MQTFGYVGWVVLMLPICENSMAIRVLGQPVAELPEYSASFPSRGYALITVLCMSSGHRLSRAALADKIWENSNDAANLANLRQLLKRMQSAKPDLAGCIEFDNRSIWIPQGCSDIDLIQFLSLGTITTGEHLIRLLDLYRGPVLEGLNLNSSHFEETLPVFRAQLANRYFSLIETGLSNLTRYGRADQSLLMNIEQHMLEMDADREETYRVLIKAYNSAGQDQEARRLFDLMSSRSEHGGLAVESKAPSGL